MSKIKLPCDDANYFNLIRTKVEQIGSVMYDLPEWVDETVVNDDDAKNIMETMNEIKTTPKEEEEVLNFAMNTHGMDNAKFEDEEIKDNRPNPKDNMQNMIYVDNDYIKIITKQPYQTLDNIIDMLIDASLSYISEKHKAISILENCIFNELDYCFKDNKIYGDETLYEKLLLMKDYIVAPLNLFKEYSDNDLKIMFSRTDWMLADVFDCMCGKTREFGLGHSANGTTCGHVYIRGCDVLNEEDRRILYYYLHTHRPTKDEEANVSLVHTLLYGAERSAIRSGYFSPKHSLDIPVNVVIDNNPCAVSFRRVLMVAFLSLIFSKEYDEFKNFELHENTNIFAANANGVEIQLDERTIMSAAVNHEGNAMVAMMRYEPGSTRIDSYDKKESEFCYCSASAVLDNGVYDGQEKYEDYFTI